MQNINTYMTALQEYWATNNINDMTLVYYDTMEELSSYIASETYLYPDEGICFGISVTQTGNDYMANLIFNDQQ